MSGAYIMLFGMIFLGIMGAVNVVLFIGSPPIYVRPDGCDDVEGKVRSALKATNGDVVIIVPESLTADTEFITICRALSADCPRVCMK